MKLPHCFLSKSVQNTIRILVCDVIPCRSVDSYHSFRAAYCLPLQGRGVNLPMHTASHPHDHFEKNVGDKGHSQSVFLIRGECDDSENVCDVPIHSTSIWQPVVSDNSHILSLVQVGLQTFKQKPYVPITTFSTQEFVPSENKNGGQEKVNECGLCYVLYGILVNEHCWTRHRQFKNIWAEMQLLRICNK